MVEGSVLSVCVPTPSSVAVITARSVATGSARNYDVEGGITAVASTAAAASCTTTGTEEWRTSSSTTTKAGDTGNNSKVITTSKTLDGSTSTSSGQPWTVQPWQHAWYHTTTSVLGIVVLLSLPYGFKYLGWAGGVILLVASTATSYLSGRIIVRLQQRGQRSYSDIADAFMWPGFSVFVVPLLLLLFFQVTVLDAIVTGQSFQAIADIVASTSTASATPASVLSLSWWIVIAGAVILCIGLIPTLAQTWYISLVGTVTAIVGAIVLVVGSGISIEHGSRDDVDEDTIEVESTLDFAMGVLNAFGLLAFA